MRRLIVLLGILYILIPAVFAQEMIETDSLTQELSDDASALLPNFEREKPADFWESLKSVFFGSLGKASDSVHSALRLCAVLLSLLTLCSVAHMNGCERAGPAANIVGALGITVAIIGNFQTMVSLSKQTLEDIAAYSSFFLPVMASSTMLSGGYSSSTVLYSGTILFSNLLMQLISKFLIPGVYFYIAVATAEAAIGNHTLSEIREFVGWLISKCLRIVMYIFIAYMSITGVISGTTDATTLKATKAAVSGMVPVVGSIVSDASESMLASATILKNSVGVFGMLAVIAICMLPFLRIAIHYLLMKVTAAVSATVGLPSHVKLLKHFSQAMGFLLGMCGACALLLLISSVCFLKVVV